MTYVAMSHQSTGYIVSASDYNQIIDNIAYLKSSISANIWLGAAGGWGSITGGAATGGQIEMATNLQNVRYISFPDGAYYQAEWAGVMPDDYNGGTLTARFYWIHPSTTTNFGVRWGIQGNSYADDEAIDIGWYTQIQVSDIGGTTYKLYRTDETTAITLAGTPAAGEFVQWRVKRWYAHADDTMAVAAYLLGVKLTYTRA